MADLAFTSRISVLIDGLLVMVVAYKSPLSFQVVVDLWNDQDWMDTNFWMHSSTIFVGLGVLSFAFVCQHSAFIIAESLERPTLSRWSQVTQAALSICAILALLCGISGYLGFLDDTRGNVINNLPGGDDTEEEGSDGSSSSSSHVLSNVARLCLGTTMLFVYPMESFVARHVLVVFLFEGRKAHEGDDTSVLARFDRRIALTVCLYLSTLVPALLCQNLGHVLAATGAVGGSCLSYIGPGAIYLGIHGDQFLALIYENGWWRRFIQQEDLEGIHTTILHNSIRLSSSNNSQQVPSETTSLLAVTSGTDPNNPGDNLHDDSTSNAIVKAIQVFTWYLLGMPVWCWIARFGEKALMKHRDDMALKSPHPSRIGDVAPNTPRPGQPRGAANKRQMEENLSNSWRDDGDGTITGGHQRANSLSFREGGELAGGVRALTKEDSASLRQQLVQQTAAAVVANSPRIQKIQKGGSSLNQQIGAKLLQAQQLDDVEKDPQKAPPAVSDFLIAIFYMIFGLVAMVAGLVSIGIQAESGG